MTARWRTIGFTVDDTGIWAAVRADPDVPDRYHRHPVVGWLTQEELGDDARPTAQVRVVAALADDASAELHPAVDHPQFIRLEYPDVREVHAVDRHGHRLP